MASQHIPLRRERQSEPDMVTHAINSS